MAVTVQPSLWSRMTASRRSAASAISRKGAKRRRAMGVAPQEWTRKREAYQAASGSEVGWPLSTGRITRRWVGAEGLGQLGQGGLQPGAPVMGMVMEHQPTATERAQPVRGRPLLLACPRPSRLGAASRHADLDLHQIAQHRQPRQPLDHRHVGHGADARLPVPCLEVAIRPFRAEPAAVAGDRRRPGRLGRQQAPDRVGGHRLRLALAGQMGRPPLGAGLAPRLVGRPALVARPDRQPASRPPAGSASGPSGQPG